MVIFTIVCCHGNSVQYTHMNENEIRGVWLIFIVNARSSRLKVETNSSFLVLHPYLGVDTVNTVGSHLKIPCHMAGAKPGNSGCFPFDKKFRFEFGEMFSDGWNIILQNCWKRGQTSVVH